MTSHTISSAKAEKAESSASPLPATEEAPTLNTNAHLVEDHSNEEEQESHQPGDGKGHDAEKETASGDERENGDEAVAKDEGEIDDDEAPPLPNETLPPLPAEAPPAAVPEEDDGWAPVWDQNVQAFYFYNRFTGATQWTNPRVPDPAVLAPPPGLEVPSSVAAPTPETQASRPAGGYDPAIHGDYDPTAWYAQPAESSTPPPATGSTPAEQYAATGAFNRFTGRWQAADLNPENFNDENKSKRQMNAFFDVDAAANSHDGRSLKAERSGKKLSKTELKQFKEKRKAKKEEKRRAWLLD